MFVKISRGLSRTWVVSRRVSRIDMSSRNLFTLPVHGKLCTCLESFVSRREKSLIPLTGHGGTAYGTSRWKLSFYSERCFAGKAILEKIGYHRRNEGCNRSAIDKKKIKSEEDSFLFIYAFAKKKIKGNLFRVCIDRTLR